MRTGFALLPVEVVSHADAALALDQQALGQRIGLDRQVWSPARGRPNLTIQANALTECLLIEGKRCVGVRYNLHGQQREARAHREVIVSAGSINSPQLLELSGIGQPELLKGLGIEVRHALKGVGENLRD